MGRFLAFHGYADPRGLDAAVSVKKYLEYLAVEREVSASTQNQALNALVFFYDKVPRAPFGEMGEFARAKRPRRLPEVMTRERGPESPFRDERRHRFDGRSHVWKRPAAYGVRTAAGKGC